MNAEHLARDAVTVYEALEDDGLVAAAVNVPCYRGRTRHVPTLPGVVRAVNGPRRFFYYSLFESDVTGAPLAVGGRAKGSIDAYAAAVGRWLVTRDGFDFLFFYLPDYDFASHALGPDRRARGARAERPRRSARWSRRRAGSTHSWSATTSSSARTTARRRSSGRSASRRRSPTSACSGQRAPGRRRARSHGVEPGGDGLPAAAARSSRGRSRSV